jgi:molecular chaperone GrpE (heat shock protein)
MNRLDGLVVFVSYPERRIERERGAAMTEEEEAKLERIKQASEKWTAEMSRAVAAADMNALLRASKEFLSVLDETETVTRELSPTRNRTKQTLWRKLRKTCVG